MIWSFFLIILCLGADIHTQKLTYTEIGTGKAVRSFRNLAHDGTHFYWITITTAGGMDIYEADALADAGSTVAGAHQDTPVGYSVDTATVNGFQNYIDPYFYPVIRAYGSDLYAAACMKKAGTGVKFLLAKRVSNVWTTSIITENTDKDFFGGEIFKIGVNFYIASFYDDAGSVYNEIYKWDGTEFKDALNTKRSIFGQSDGTKFYFYQNNKIRSFDGTVYTDVQAFYTYGGTYGSHSDSFCIWQDNYIVVGMMSAIRTVLGIHYGRKGDTTIDHDLVNYARPSFYYNSVSGQIETKFLVGDNSKLYFLPFCGTIALATMTLNNGGWDGSYDMCTGAFTISKCYTIALETDSTTDAIFHLPIMRPPTGEWHSQTAPVAGEVKAIYDNAGNLVTILKHGKPTFDGILYNDMMYSPSKRDLDKLVTEDYSSGALGDDGIVTDLLQKYCDFIQKGTLAASSAYTNKFKFVNRPLYLCLLDICLFNKRIFYLESGYLLNYNAANVDSTINLTSSDTDLGFAEKLQLLEKRSEVTVIGNLNLESMEVDDVLENIWRTVHPSIIDQTTLDTMADNIIAITNGSAVTVIRVLRANATLIPIGETFDCEYNISPWNLVDAPYINMNLSWQNIGNLCTYTGYTAIYWAKWIEDVLRSPEAVNSRISALEAAIDTDGTLAANSDSRIPSQKAAKAYADESLEDYCAVKKSTNLTLTQDTWVLHTWDTEIADTNTMHDNSTNSERITCKKSGKYLVSWFIVINAGGANSGFTRLSLNGSETTNSMWVGSATYYPSSSGTIVLDLAVNDYLHLHSYSAGAASTMLGALRSYFIAKYLGP